MAAAAIRRAHDFSWERKAEALDAIYSRAVGAKGLGHLVAQASKAELGEAKAIQAKP